MKNRKPGRPVRQGQRNGFPAAAVLLCAAALFLAVPARAGAPEPETESGAPEPETESGTPVLETESGAPESEAQWLAGLPQLFLELSMSSEDSREIPDSSDAVMTQEADPGPAPVLVGSTGDAGILVDNSLVLDGREDNGYHVSADLTDVSNIVVIGDSRVVGMSSDVGRVSYNGTVGAHYIYEESWAKRAVPMVIPVGLEDRGEETKFGTGYYAEMVSLVQSSMEKHGSCLVVIVATVNDEDYYGWRTLEAERMMELGAALTEDGSVNGRAPEIHYMGMVPLEGMFRTEYHGYTAEHFNEYLKECVLASGTGEYIGIGSVSEWDGLYVSDGIHFKQEGSQLLFDRILHGLEEP